METFDQLIRSETPVVVDFYADWCGPCKAMVPVLKEVAGQLEGKARVIKINIDKNQRAANHYKVQTVPTFMIFKKGNMVWRHSGTIDKKTLLQQVLSLS